MALFDKLAQRGIDRLGKTPNPSILGVPTAKPIASPQQIIQNTPTTPQRALTTTPTGDRVGQLPERGQLASTFQGGKVQKRFLADLPANVQLQGIESILAGQDTNNQGLNQFVKTLAVQGKTPEQIRLAFVESQRNSPDPLVIM